MKRIKMKRLIELAEDDPRIAQLINEMDEHDARRIAKLMNELHGYALQHGYSDKDLYDAAYAFTIEPLSLVSKRDAREVLRKLEEGADGLREVLNKAGKKGV